jgi:hypothetical protein
VLEQLQFDTPTTGAVLDCRPDGDQSLPEKLVAAHVPIVTHDLEQELVVHEIFVLHHVYVLQILGKYRIDLTSFVPRLREVAVDRESRSKLDVSSAVLTNMQPIIGGGGL